MNRFGASSKDDEKRRILEAAERLAHDAERLAYDVMQMSQVIQTEASGQQAIKPPQKKKLKWFERAIKYAQAKNLWR